MNAENVKSHRPVCFYQAPAIEYAHWEHRGPERTYILGKRLFEWTSRTVVLLTTSWILLSLFFAGSTGLVFAQSICPEPPAYALLRQDDDYGYLRDPSCRKDFWDAVKNRSLNSKGDRYLTIGGEIREWYEGFRNANFGMGPQDGNGFLLQRLTLYSDWHVGNSIRFFGQLTSDIEAGRNGGPQPTDEAKLWVEQGFADIRALATRDSSLTFRIGRQELEFGSGRLVDVREGPNVRLAFDGIDVIVKGAAWNVNAFATRPVINNVNVFDDPPDHAVMFWGAYAVRPLPATRGGNIDLYYLGIDKKQAKFDRGTAQEIRHTLGTRFWGTRGAWNYNWEAMLQLGNIWQLGDTSVGHRNGYGVHAQPSSSQATTGRQNDAHEWRPPAGLRRAGDV